MAPARSRRRDAPGGAVRGEGAQPPRPKASGEARWWETPPQGRKREIRFPDDLLRRHHLYVARTRMGKSTLMHHVAVHKLREKAAGRDGDAIVVVDPHTDLVAGILEHVPDSLIDRVRLIDLSDESRAPGINLLDTRIFSDRDRTADSVVRVAKGLWEQWGPRMQSILEQTVKTLHEANEQVEAEQQYTILDGLKLLSVEKFRKDVLKKVSDPYLLEWWGQGLRQVARPVPGRGPGPGPDPPLLLRLFQAGKGHPGPAPLHHRPAQGHPRRRHPARLDLPGNGGQGRGRPGGRVAPQPRGRRDTGAGKPAAPQTQGRPRRGGRDAVDARRGLRVDAVRAGQVRGELSSSPPRAWRSSTTSPAPCGTRCSPTRAASPSSRWRATTPGRWCGSWARSG